MKNRAFTIIELIVVIAIIVLLTGIVLGNVAAPKAKSRDAKRISDISQIRLALELYFDRCKAYPSALDIGDGTNCPSGINFGTYMGTVPRQPGGESYGYARSSSGTDYVLYVKLESANDDVVRDGLGTPNPLGSTFPCSNAASSKDYCVGPK